METLGSDLKKILTGSAELVSRAKSLQAPSWKFPEKLAASLDLEDCLKQQDVKHHDRLKLELIIDRLLLVIQCCVFELEGARGHRQTNIPFTLGSAVKRLSKCIIQNTTHLVELTNQLSSKSKKINALESSVTSLSSATTSTKPPAAIPLQASVPSQSSGTEDRATLELASPKKIVETSDVCIQTTDTAFMLCAQCSTIQSTLVNMASLVTGLCKVQSISSRLGIYDWEALVKKGGIDIVTWSDSMRIDMVALEENTSLLIGKVEGLSSERDRLNKQVALLKEKNQSSDIHINALKDLLTRSDVALNESKRSFASDMAQVQSTHSDLKARNTWLKDKNTEIKKELVASREKIESLTASMKDLELSRYQMEADLYAMDSREKELQQAKKSLEEQLDSVVKQSQEVLKDSQVELNKVTVLNQSLEKKCKTLKSKQTSLLAQLDALDVECGTLRTQLTEVSVNREALANNLKQVQAQYSLVQQHLSEEQAKLSEANKVQYRLDAQLSTLKDELADTKKQVEMEKHNCRLLMDYPFVKQIEEDYPSHLASLAQNRGSHKQISANTIRILLLEEQNNELRKKTDKESKELKELIPPVTLKVNNPVQLWEPELVSTIQRQQASIRAKQQHQLIADLQHPSISSSNVYRNLLEPIVPQVGQELVRKSRSTGTARETSRKNQSAKDSQRWHSQDSRGQRNRISSGGDAVLKGHLGHLANAVAEAHKKEVTVDKSLLTTDVDKRKEVVENKNLLVKEVDVHSCENCDTTLSGQEELKEHNLSCIKLS